MNKHTILKDDLPHSGDGAPENGHDAWTKEKIEAALQKKKEGVQRINLCAM